MNLWRTDGTVDGTRIVADLAPGVPSPDIRQIVTVGDVVFFTADLWPEAASRSGQRHLWRSDGTPEGTYVVQYEDGFNVRAPLRFVRWQDSLYVVHARMPNFDDRPLLSLYRVQADFGAKLELVSASLPAASIDALNEFQMTATRDSLFLAARSRVMR